MKQLFQVTCTTLILVLALTPAAKAQPGPAPVGMMEAPCAVSPVMPAGVSRLLSELFMVPHTLVQEDFAKLMGNKEFAEYNGALRSQGMQDWPQLCRFHAANADYLASGKNPRIVFMGDSITENWLLGDPDLFNDASLNRGLSAQTTPHMLLRFRADVVALQPDLVHILAGTNDVAGNTGPNSPQDFKNNIMSMVDLARANGIGVLLASIPPAATFNWQPELKPVPIIRELNAWMKAYAAENKLPYVDYYSVLTDPQGGLRAELSNDGVHPNYDGYAQMRRVLDVELAKLE